MKYKQFKNQVHGLNIVPRLTVKQIKGLWGQGYTIGMIKNIVKENEERRKITMEKKESDKVNKDSK